MERRLKPGGLDFAKTHPPPNDRIRHIRPAVEKAPPGAPATAERKRRFHEATASLR